MVVCCVAGVVSVRHAGDALHAGARIERRGRFLVHGVAGVCGRRVVRTLALLPPTGFAFADTGSRVVIWRVV